jgi:hypothetical protein
MEKNHTVSMQFYLGASGCSARPVDRCWQQRIKDLQQNPKGINANYDFESTATLRHSVRCLRIDIFQQKNSSIRRTIGSASLQVIGFPCLLYQQSF